MQADVFSDALAGLITSLPVRAARQIARRVDGWYNAITAMGTIADKVAHTQPDLFMRGLSDAALASMFHADWIVRKAVTKRPSDALRFGFRVSVPDDAGGQDTATAIQDGMDDLDAVGAFKLACFWENLFGGAVIFMGLDDGQTAVDSQAQPVRWEQVRSVLWLRVIDRRRLQIDDTDLVSDERDPEFGKPSHYKLWDQRTGTQLRIHKDRLIVFPGIATTDEIRRARNGWGVSLIDPMFEAVQRSVTAWQSSGNAIANAQYVVYKLKGLGHMLGMPDGEEKLKGRTRAMEMAKSLINALLIDADDDYLRENPNFGNMPDMLQAFMLEICAAIDIPMTIMFGRSPAGMNATGESDTEAWHSSCDEFREHHLRPRAQQFILAVMSAKDGPTRGVIPDGWRVTFPPMRQLSDLQRADVRLKTSQADASDIDRGVLLPQEVAKSRFRPEGYSIETQIDLELRDSLMKMEIEARKRQIEMQGQPPEGPEGEPEPEKEAAE